MSRLVLVLVGVVLLATGCSAGSSDAGSADRPASDGAATSTPSGPGAGEKPSGPDCDTIWKAGNELPADYTRCTTGGEYADQDVTKCQDGTALVAYLDSFYAVTGGKIVQPEVAPMQDTEEFGAAYAACTGEQ